MWQKKLHPNLTKKIFFHGNIWVFVNFLYGCLVQKAEIDERGEEERVRGIRAGGRGGGLALRRSTWGKEKTIWGCFPGPL